jgi:hypothetical protein
MHKQSEKRKSSRNITRIFQPKQLYVRIRPLIDCPVVDIGKTLPSYDTEEMQTLRHRLGEVKSKLDHYYLGGKHDAVLKQKWLQCNNILDLYSDLRHQIATKFHTQHVTNAWLKYWEIYNQWEIVSNVSNEFTAFFNAELPGAALCAYNHFTVMKKIPAKWWASSIAPGEKSGNSDVLDDKYGLYAKNKDRWLMSSTNNGDATKIENINDWAAKLGTDSEVNGIHLYSHDAGIDVSTDSAGNLGFNNQEIANAKIHLGCALAGFVTMRPGANFIAKQYTWFEPLTWNLIMIYSGMFEEFYLCKPMTSRPYNSEIYLLGKGFKGISDKMKKILYNKLENFDMTPLIPLDAVRIMGSDILEELHRFARIIYHQQIHAIEENIMLFEKYRNRLSDLRDGLRQQRDERMRNWLQTYPIEAIPDEFQLKSY